VSLTFRNRNKLTVPRKRTKPLWKDLLVFNSGIYLTPAKNGENLPRHPKSVKQFLHVYFYRQKQQLTFKNSTKIQKVSKAIDVFGLKERNKRKEGKNDK